VRNTEHLQPQRTPCARHSLCYTGTHDNPTTRGWDADLPSPRRRCRTCSTWGTMRGWTSRHRAARVARSWMRLCAPSAWSCAPLEWPGNGARLRDSGNTPYTSWFERRGSCPR